MFQFLSMYTFVLSREENGNEREKLDRELGPLELDKSLEQANTKSAPGVDGFSYIFI